MNKDLANKVINEINVMAKEEIKIMEVCGTHTNMIAKMGLKSVLVPNIKLISGPGCPVCVTDESFIDQAIELSNCYGITIVTFGDLIRVKGTNLNLLSHKGSGKEIIVIYSPLEIINLALSNPEKKFVFLGVGFETTAPILALTIKNAADKGIKNLFFLNSIKLMSPILHYIFTQSNHSINALICPGHVAVITGSDYFKFISGDYHLPCAVAGFEAEDILLAIYTLVNNRSRNKDAVIENLYKRCVTCEGNRIAKQLVEEVFKVCNGIWRGIGIVKDSSLMLNAKYENFDALKVFALKKSIKEVNTCCSCKDILLGNKQPNECSLFEKRCNPITPYGPCMVSTEGACAIAYRYKEVGI